MVDGHAGKGDRYRPVDRKKWDENPVWDIMKEKSKRKKRKKESKNE